LRRNLRKVLALLKKRSRATSCSPSRVEVAEIRASTSERNFSNCCFNSELNAEEIEVSTAPAKAAWNSVIRLSGCVLLNRPGRFNPAASASSIGALDRLMNLDDASLNR